MSDDRPPTFDEFYAHLHDLWHQKRDKTTAADYYKTTIAAHPELMDKLKAAHAGVAQVVAARGFCDPGIAATYTMLQSLFDQFPEERARLWQTTRSVP